MSGAGKKVLRNGIVAMLFAGGWISGGINAGAVTVDMTSSENLDGIHVSATSKIEIIIYINGIMYLKVLLAVQLR